MIEGRAVEAGNRRASGRFAQRLFCLLLLIGAGANVRAELPGGAGLWVAAPPRIPAVELYFFWSSRCPHCLEARPLVESLPEQYPWIRVHSLEILNQPENLARFSQLARIVGFEPSSVPTFVWCGRHATGFAGPETTGRYLLGELVACYRDYYGVAPDGSAIEESDDRSGPASERRPSIAVPLFGSLDTGSYSLPLMAVLMGGLDAFNPCAFFVLLFLLSLLVNGRSRKRMVLIGGLYVTVSGLVYFAFMAAWLNLFQLLEGVQAITLTAGLVALVIGMVNVKDYFLLGKGVTLSLSGTQRSSLFARMRGLVSTDHLPSLVLGTLALAIAANSYELLCTMGLPMVFTRILTLEQLPTLQYYAYLALYNLVYVLPLAIIVAVFVTTMGRRKLSESGGRFLKLLSGTMMVALGLALVFAPDLLSRPLAAVLLMLAAVLLSLLVRLFYREPLKTGH